MDLVRQSCGTDAWGEWDHNNMCKHVEELFFALMSAIMWEPSSNMVYKEQWARPLHELHAKQGDDLPVRNMVPLHPEHAPIHTYLSSTFAVFHSSGQLR